MKLLCKTERMSLVMLDRSSTDLVLDYVIRNRAFLEPWELERNEAYFTRAYQADQLEQEAKKIEEGQLIKAWLMIEDRVVGSISLSNIVRGAFQSCHLGYRMDENLLNRGLMTEGLKAIIAYAFEEMSLHRIEANIMPRNGASLKVVAKLGFYEEGLALKYLKIHGVWEDHIHMVLRNKAME
ncbi:ribosomal-protein-alanine N-acetyltransferase [Paenibacillus sp. yr247]|uniref:GNAT family N-acetyltransferase n=1 Tax=Paenibacillus sp. yr247 TaxID=1761880 RepID=UPI00088F2F07|nr:GNAT family N-acetyltransferase [Paenibacillus sp. yr247]SDM91826.1 ribosomal-protein-alanine N-acetyltransferase [Paenibacillus sp. yr247]